MNIIEVKNLKKQFRGREVVKGIDMVIPQSEIIALIGTNGAGKSTTMAMMLGIVQPDQGTITYWREDYRNHIGVQLQSTPFFEGYTAKENLRMFAALYRVKLDKKQLDDKLKECHLLDEKNTPASRLSGGQQKQLAIAVTTLHNPDFIVLDEPAAGLDPLARRDIRNMIVNLSKKNVTILFSSHDMEEVSHIATGIVFMHEGMIVAQGRPEQLLQKYAAENLEELYLTLTEGHNNENNI